MKIISTKPAKSVVKRIVCDECGATLEYVPKDVKRYDGTDIGRRPDGMKWVDCPNCKNKIVLDRW
jgi:hypothetical protein